MTIFPDDENGDVLRRMQEQGDDLTQPRMIDYCFVFAARAAALEFAQSVLGEDLEVCLSYFETRRMWQVVVKKFMTPTHAEISALEAELMVHAKSLQGEADGWGCMQVT
jgi:hypothetical protein